MWQREPNTDVLVSILTPSFNHRRFLEDCLASVKLQVDANLEHIIMDGGSTDGTVEYLASLSVSDSRRWVSEPDRGQTHALLKAFQMSRGSIIGWVNSDDGYATRNIVSHVVRQFASNPEIGVVYAHALLVSAKSEVLHILPAPRFDPVLMALGSRIYQPAVFVRRAVLEQHGFVDESFNFAMDYELWRRLHRNGVRFLHLAAIAAVDRHHSGRKVERNRAALDEETNRVRPLPGAIGQMRWRLANVALRLQGTAMIDDLYRTDLLPIWKLPPRGVLYTRQLVLPRRFQGSNDN
jgi:glycosyltransferase involved in cell wall biosynthesis